ncbi:MAG: nucleotidyltransferase [Bacilli bacterium]|nr:nucleotidyltransferase [Bacilli bacterium]
MDAVGIIAEYNPFHNGHLYHINKVKELCGEDIIIVVLSGHFMQRGEVSVINKWDKTKIALLYGADIVIELPFPFATQAADIFAKGSIEILNHMKVKRIVFGSESNNIDELSFLAETQLKSPLYQVKIKEYMNEGLSYPDALSKALYDVTKKKINTPNDILGISYIKEILKNNYKIEPISIKRTNDYHDLSIKENIVSASNIRESLKLNKDIKKQVPKITYEYLKQDKYFIEDYFKYLKYKILSNIDNLNIYQTVDEGIENRIKKYILESTSLDELINKVKTKRYTYNKIRRMFCHIINNFTKEEASKFKDINYLRILGFSDKGQAYLNSIKKDLNIPLVTKFNKVNNKMLDLEFRSTCVYASILDENKKQELIEKEFKNSPIKRNEL